jgi:hypothetical protein
MPAQQQAVIVGGHAIGHLHINEIPHFKSLKTIFYTFVA